MEEPKPGKFRVSIADLSLSPRSLSFPAGPSRRAEARRPLCCLGRGAAPVPLLEEMLWLIAAHLRSVPPPILERTTHATCPSTSKLWKNSALPLISPSPCTRAGLLLAMRRLESLDPDPWAFGETHPIFLDPPSQLVSATFFPV